MSSQELPKLIKGYIHKQGMSIRGFERKADLKTNVVRNILTGQSKRPTVETLKALAAAMGCSVQDLLGSEKEPFESVDTIFSGTSCILEQPKILEESLQYIHKIIEKNDLKLTLHQIFFILGEVYSYSVKKNPAQVDADFVEWFITYHIKGK